MLTALEIVSGWSGSIVGSDGSRSIVGTRASPSTDEMEASLATRWMEGGKFLALCGSESEWFLDSAGMMGGTPSDGAPFESREPPPSESSELMRSSDGIPSEELRKRPPTPPTPTPPLEVVATVLLLL